jgi:hypothetical protein
MFQPEKVERDVYGYWFHSAVRDSEEDQPINELPGAEGMEFRYVSFDNDASEKMQRRYFEDDEFNISDWNPTKPEGDGWFLLCIYDTEDGPHACFTRPKADIDSDELS